ncbi:hypothetical protein ABBQ38_011726 [Trebouxia sp. C0009 RCD-2024]
MQIWAVSDVHTDYPDNLAWCEDLDTHSEDCLIVAGDISDDVQTFAATLRCFTQKFKHVFFVPGNHDLWTRREERGKHTSLEKLEVLRRLCTELGVHTAPCCIEGVWLVPLYSWYHASFDAEPDIPGALPAHKIMVDFHACSWPEALDATSPSLAMHFDQMNEEPVTDVMSACQSSADASCDWPPVITFSHFLPLQALLPEKRMLYQPNLAKAAGSNFLATRIQQLKPVAHVFGHTHFNWDCSIDGVRYLQRPLAYPKERRKHGAETKWAPALVYDTKSGLASQRHAYWSDYYLTHSREVDDVLPAPWVSLGR